MPTKKTCTKIYNNTFLWVSRSGLDLGIFETGLVLTTLELGYLQKSLRTTEGGEDILVMEAHC